MVMVQLVVGIRALRVALLVGDDLWVAALGEGFARPRLQRYLLHLLVKEIVLSFISLQAIVEVDLLGHLHHKGLL